MNKKQKIEPGFLPEVDELLGSPMPELGENRFEENWDEPGKKRRRARKQGAARRKKRSLKWIPVVAVLLLLAAGGGAVAVAEPWVPAVKDTFTPKPTTELDPLTLAVGDSHTVQVPLGENEVVASIEVADPDILVLSGDTFTARGEYFETTLTVRTCEKELPTAKPAHEIVIFGQDRSAEYEALRRFLRDLFGVEKIEDIPTEVRDVAVYTQRVTVKGLDKVTDNPPREIEACLQNSVVLELLLNEGETALVSAPGSAAEVSVIAESNGRAWINIKGNEVAKTTVKTTVGVWKAVSAETYARYAATTGALIDTAHPNQIFVPRRMVNYTISVADLSRTEVATELEGEDVVEVYALEDGFSDEVMRDVLALVNALRKEANLPELAWSDALAAAAKTRAQELSGKYGHLRPDGSNGLSAAEAAKQEMIGCGFVTAEGVFAAWCSEDGLLNQLLSADCTQFGGAFYRVEDGTYNNYQCALLG